MITKICIDTDVCVDFLRNRAPGVNHFLSAVQKYRCVISAVTAYELVLGSKLMKTTQDIEGFIQNLEVVPFSLEVAKIAGELHAELRSRHLEIGLPDIFIAASCLYYGLPLLTMNRKHYSRIEGLHLL